MTFPITFLSAEMPLTKSYALSNNGDIVKTPYPSAYRFTSHTEQIDTLDQFAQHLKNHSVAGHCILKGQLNRELINQSRAGSTNGTDSTHWVCLDFDGLPARPIDDVLELLGLQDISYVLQWSASYKIPAKNDALRCHVFMLLDKPATPPQLREWLVHLNLSTPFLRENTTLALSGATLKWGLDVTACQNDKLLYIADPKLIGIPNPFSKGRSRVNLVKKKKAAITLIPGAGPEANRAAQQVRVAELRGLLGLPARKAGVYKAVEGANQQVLANPDEASITGIREERGFIYFNLNGGDSWGYYHPAENADVIYNFKGEDPSLTSKLLPAYYLEAKSKAKQAQKEYAAELNVGVHVAKSRDESDDTLTQFLSFQDKHGTYWCGRYHAASDTLELNKKKSEKQVRDFCAQYAVPIGDFIPEWSIVFDPQMKTRVDEATRTVNVYKPSSYLAAPLRKVTACPPTIFKVIHHALGSEVEITEHFMNWLAFLVQKRDRSGTAWVLYGTEGTGKGVLYEHVLKPLLGKTQCTMNRVEEMLKGFNGFVKNKLLCVFDEVHIGAMKEQEEILGRMRNMITEPEISIRDLYSSPEPVPNLTNFLLFSNKRDVVMINTTDRRYNIGGYQQTKLIHRHKEFGEKWEDTLHMITQELQNFAHYLRSYPLNEQAARTPLDTAGRNTLIATTVSSADQIAEFIGQKTAHMASLMDLLPANELKLSAAMKESARDFKQVLIDNMLRTMERIASPKRNAQEACGVMSREEARTIFEYCVGGMKDGPTRFTQYLRHRHLEPCKVWVEGKAVMGLKTDWTDVKHFPSYLKTLGYKEKA